MNTLRMFIGRRGDLSCMKVMRLVQSYLDGATDDITTAKVARHLADCRRCGLEADTFRAIKDALGRREDSLPADSLERLRGFVNSLGEDQGGTTNVGSSG